MDSLHLSDKVFFLGRLAREEIVDLYHSADVMLNPTTVDNMPNSVLEGWPNVVLEAMACGVPVISTNVGGVPYLLRDGYTGLLVDRGNVQQMARAIGDLYHGQTLRTKLSQNGRSEVAKYSWAEVGPKWQALYKEVEITA